MSLEHEHIFSLTRSLSALFERKFPQGVGATYESLTEARHAADVHFDASDTRDPQAGPTLSDSLEARVVEAARLQTASNTCICIYAQVGSN